MYFVDIYRGLHIRYEQKGWKIVTAGKRTNCDFFDILKTLLSISDAVISQGFTSALAYAACMNIPINLWRETAQLCGHSLSHERAEGNTLDEDKFEDMFSEFDMEVSEAKKKYIDYLWGASGVLEPSVLNNILELAAKLERSKPNKYLRILNNSKFVDLFSIVEKTKWYSSLLNS